MISIHYSSTFNTRICARFKGRYASNCTDKLRDFCFFQCVRQTNSQYVSYNDNKFKSIFPLIDVKENVEEKFKKKKCLIIYNRDVVQAIVMFNIYI